MANFLSGLAGNQGIAKVIGTKAGEFVEDAVEKALSGKDKAKGESAGKDKGGVDLGDVLSFGGKSEEKGGLDMGDALSLIGGSKDKDKGDGGLDLSGALSGFMK